MANGSFDLLLLLVGAMFLAAAVLPPLIRRTPLSLPILYVAVGALLAWLWPGAPRIDPTLHRLAAERITEFAVMIALMSAGLKIDRRFGWHRWRSSLRLLSIPVPLSITALTVGGVWLLDLPLAAALLLAAVMASTDQVLGSSVQVWPAGRGDGGEARFALTSAGGLNDAIVFPTVNLAAAIAVTGLGAGSLLGWLGRDVALSLALSLAVGAAIGHAVARLVFRSGQASVVSDGFVALALSLLVYGSAHVLGGYGFLAVFTAALVFRAEESDHEYHVALHDFSEQLETLLVALLLITFGAAIAHGLLDALTWPGALLGLAFLLVIRPLGGWLALTGLGLPPEQRAVMAVFGIRGIATFFYLAHGLGAVGVEADLARTLWSVAGFTVLASVVLHGATAKQAMRSIGEEEVEEGEPRRPEEDGEG
jgi:sodium/hydrogen antiporter